jgi:ribosomal protein S18 acetylase RimI-like enzyme
MIAIKRMQSSEIDRIGEIDRSEHVTTSYTIRDGKLEAEAVDWQVPRWFDDGPVHSVPGMVGFLSPLLANESKLWGAFDGDALVGVLVYRPHLTENMAQLAFLHVSHGYRRQGIATRLTAECVRLAREDSAEQLYVSATPSGSAVGFYQSQGFQLVDKPHPELFALEPEATLNSLAPGGEGGYSPPSGEGLGEGESARLALFPLTPTPPKVLTTCLPLGRGSYHKEKTESGSR